MNQISSKILLSILTLHLLLQANSQNAIPYYSDPAISPDSREIAFIHGGDIWTVPSSGGEARLLLSNPATESRPLYSPDGKSIAFNSSRSGNGDVYSFNMETGMLHRLTYDDGFDEVSAWSKDGRYLYFSSTNKDIAGMRDMYRVDANGGTPMLVADNRYVTEFHGAPSPDGKSMVFVARGFGAGQWWRNGSSHLDESEIWLLTEGANPSYTKLADRGAKQLWPMWSADGKSIYYVSDRSGKENLWKLEISGKAKQLTSFNSGRVLWPSLSLNEESIVFERDFSIWKYAVKSGESKKVSISLRGAPAGPAIERSRLTSGFRELSVSPDNKKVAFTARGDLFVAGAKDGGDATRVTMTSGAESQPTWTANSNSIYYISDRNGASHIYKFDFISNKESQLTNNKEDDSAPLLSPDGKTLAFVRDGRELRTIELATGKETMITKAYIGFAGFTSTGTLAWSPDGKWLAYGGFGPKALYNLYVVPSTGGEPRPVSFLANSFGGNVTWAKDGRSIFFTTAQRTEDAYLARIDLVPQMPRFREDQFRDLFVDQVPTTPVEKPSTKESTVDSISAKPAIPSTAAKITWEGLRERLSFVPLGTEPEEFILSKDGNTLVMTSSAASQQNIYSYSLDELSRDAGVLKQLTTTSGRKTNLQFSQDNKEVWFFEGGRIQSVNVESKQVKPLSITAEMDIDFSKEKMEMFKQAWESQNKGFYDPNFHGKDWNAVRRTFEPYAAGAQTPDELRRILNLMVGELDASHSGVSGPGGGGSTTGRTGLRFDRNVYEKEGLFKIKEVVALSPAALSEKISVGDYLVAVDGKKINAGINLEQLLENKIGKKTVLTVSNVSGSNTREVTIRPVSLSVEKGLLYKQWVQQKREYISKISNGRLGYVHMYDMGQGSLDQLYIDMDAENHSKDGVVVDVRNNNGGFVNAFALDVLSRKGYMNMTRRGLPEAPARVQLGQRALDAPTVLVTNQHSLSDAEDFAEGYRALGLGKVVGEPTAGWIIYTSSRSLIDGSSIRLPFIKITDSKGNNMELEPRPVDVSVSNPLGEEDRDRQLDMAVKVLLEQIDKGRK